MAGGVDTDNPKEDDEKIGSPGVNHHALAIGGAHHAFKGGHIDKVTRDKIVASARAAMAKQKAERAQFQSRMKQAQTAAAPSPRFGSLMPAIPQAVPPMPNVFKR
jgi:hypothetical protein